LTDDSNKGVPNKTIEIKESDPIGDDLLGTVLIDSQGDYPFDWLAEDVETFGNAEIFAEFRGDATYSLATSSEVMSKYSIAVWRQMKVLLGSGNDIREWKGANILLCICRDGV